MVLTAVHPAGHGDERGNWVLDIVAVHGLDEDQTETWIDPSSGTLWLSDLLPHTILRARVLTFGYKADASSFFGNGSSDRILQHAHTLVAELEADRAIDGAAERPIIFICHGLGGILVKRALAHSATRVSKKVEHLYSVFTSTYGILFMGTPHHGINKTSWLAMAQNAAGAADAPSQLLTALARHSETLQNINDQFAPLTKQFRIFFFWEQLQTDLGPKKSYVVEEDSAAPTWDNTERSGIYANHSQMCKFASNKAPGFTIVVAALLRYAREAETTIEFRWQEARKLLAVQHSNEAAELMGFDIYHDSKRFIHQSEATTQPRNKHFLIPHNVSSIFTGRDDITRRLQQKILSPSATDAPRQQKRFVLYGLGGSGKTQFCLKFAQDNRDSFWGIFWIDASSVENAEIAYSEIGRIGGMGENSAAGKHWLSNLDLSWLLVIDNADDPSIDVSRFFPAGDRGHILLTSRNPECRVHSTIGYHEFKGMDHEDAITLLLKAADVKDHLCRKVRDLAGPIAATLGYLPLALIQAGASIRQNICPLEDYLNVYSRHRKQIMSNQAVQGTDHYRYTIYTTWEVSFQMIERQETEAAADAIEILHVFAFLHFERVPASIFERAWRNLRRLHTLTPSKSLFARILGSMFAASNRKSQPRLPRILRQEGPSWDSYRFRQAIAILSSFSLIVNDAAMDSYSMHPVVRFWARDRLQKADQELWFDITTTTLAESITWEFEASNHTYQRSLVPHIDSCLQGEHTEQLIGNNEDSNQVLKAAKFAYVYSENGRWPEATELQVKVMDMRLKTLGLEHTDTLKAIVDLGWTYWNLGRMNEAEELQLKVMNARIRTLGTDNPATLKAMDNLAQTYWLYGRMADAEDLGLKAMDGMIRSLGPGDPDTLMAMHNLGRTYMHRGRPKQAQQLQVQVLEARRKMLGAEHPDTLMAMSSLGMSYNALRRLAEAESLLTTVVEARKRTLGQEHAYTLWAINDLSKIYCEQGRAVQAEELLDKIWDVVARTLGNEHIGMLMTMYNLARAYAGQGRWTDAEVILTNLVEVQSRKLGPEHPDRLIAMSELARGYRHQARLEEAEKLFSKVIEAMTRKLGLEHPRTLSAMGELALIYKQQARLGEAETIEAKVAKQRIPLSKSSTF
ncbi:MAG: hypothetical protein M1830_001965 [Pleopsidium flavum]|nr:MAG: hypothetical protein M1830_001965 [Pleopsidium flavum]